MKEDTFSFVDLFQDPIFTYIALILIGTIWIIIPGQAVESNMEKDLKAKIATVSTERDRQAAKIQDTRREITEKEAAIVDMEHQTKDLQSRAQALQQQTADLDQKINKRKQGLVQTHGGQQQTLPKELKAKDALVKFDKKINDLNQAVAAQGVALGRLEEQLNKAQGSAAENERTRKQQEEQKARLEQEMKDKTQQVKLLQDRLNAQAPSAQASAGFKFVREVKNKESVGFEVNEGRVIPIDRKHYSGTRVGSQGITIQPKKNVRGEGLKELESPRSEFQKALNKANKNKQFVIFLVRRDSFQAFRQARQLAARKGFAIGWWPLEGSINFGEGGRGRTIPAAD
jgi:hypothetical protein